MASGNKGDITYVLTRVIFIRSLALVYLVAFLVAYNQNPGLIGDNGLLSSQEYFGRLKRHVGPDRTPLQNVVEIPTLLWFFDHDQVSQNIQQFALAGATLSAFVIYHGACNSVGMFLLWALYHSIVSVGQRWYSFGWETQLLETGFIGIFIVPTFSLNRFERVPRVGIYAAWWLIFRIMIGAGLIKIRGDSCWRDLTCMDYHYETQPVPNPVSFYLHNNPLKIFHKLETLVNHIVELVTPWFMFCSRDLRVANGVIQIIFQLILISSGNLSFLNWLTILPSLCFLDDQFLIHWFPFLWSNEAKEKVIGKATNQGTASMFQNILYVLKITKNLGFAILIMYLSTPVIRNLLALDGHQHMNTSFDTFKIVNTYGAFGSITKVRTEVIFKGTNDDISMTDPSKIVWQEYEFKCKPGDVQRRPCLISPYHYRLDWLLWFAAFGDYNQHPWIVHLTYHLLRGHKDAKEVHDLIEFNPFHNQTKPPKFIKVDHYEYKFAPLDHQDKKAWWIRRYLKEYLPPLSLENESFQNFIGKK